MKHFMTIARKLTLYIVMAVVIGGYPLAAFADDAAPADDTTQTPNYTYDPATNHWNTDEWRYDPASGVYVPNTPPATTTPTPDSSADTTPATTDTVPATDPSVSDDSQNTVQDTTSNNNQINNDVSGQSTTGDATVQSNTTAGSATSGNSTDIATVLNNINSVSALSGQPVAFTQDIYGNVTGDIVLAPQLMQAMAQTTSPTSGSQTVNYDVVNNNNLTNTVNLSALSGDASVLDNTSAGNATSGNATAIANVLNIVNSIIAANKSFIGTINIHGNLTGDILMSQDGSPTLLASNAVSAPFSPGDLLANQTNLTNALNNVNLNAASGNATVDNNTTAGSATTGTADTNLVIMNLVGQNVLAKDSLLVFVNVLGTWVGIIVNAPTGATAAVLGDGVTSNVAAAPRTTTINADNQTNITNNITVGAQTGDATVAGNTSAGNATSGNATASATILNMANSTFSLSDWFGVLFINVLGSWHGSFGVDTPYGNPETPAAQGTNSSQQPPAETTGVAAPQVFRFISHALTGTAGGGTGSANNNTSLDMNAATSDTTDAAVLAASDTSSFTPIKSNVQPAGQLPETISMPAATGIFAGLALGLVLVIRAIAALRTRFA